MNTLSSLCSKLLHFLKLETANQDELKTRFHGSYFKSWESGDIVALLKEKFDITAENINELMKALQEVVAFDSNNFRGERNSADELTKADDSGSITTVSVEKCLMFAQYVLRDNFKSMDDFV